VCAVKYDGLRVSRWKWVATGNAKESELAVQNALIAIVKKTKRTAALWVRHQGYVVTFLYYYGDIVSCYVDDLWCSCSHGADPFDLFQYEGPAGFLSTLKTQVAAADRLALACVVSLLTCVRMCHLRANVSLACSLAASGVVAWRGR
jgi:hypothetical protein